MREQDRFNPRPILWPASATTRSVTTRKPWAWPPATDWLCPKKLQP